MATAISATLPPVTYVPDDQTSEVQLLYQQGLSSAEIATILGLSVGAVNGYLGTAVPGVVSLPSPPAPTPAPVVSSFPSVSVVA
jgi:hypothetical protein